MSVQNKKKKKGIISRIGNKIKGDAKDELVLDTLSELKDIVGSMREVFDQFEDGYEQQLTEERSTWDKIQIKLPKFMQSTEIKNEERRMERIRSNKNTLGDLEDNFTKLELVLTSSTATIESMSEAYLDSAIPGEKNAKAVQDLEKRMSDVENNLGSALEGINVQMSLIKTALDNMASQLDDQGVVMEGIDEKIDVIDDKLDVAHTMLKKISKKITGNRIMMFAVVGGVAFILSQMLTK
jgi:uncharacterized coiled-coil protein SlyX